jgi:hypothetical protein
VLRDQRDGGYSRKLANQMTQCLDLLGETPVHGHEYRVNRALADDTHGLRDRIPMHHGEAAAPRGVDPRPLDRKQDRCHGG